MKHLSLRNYQCDLFYSHALIIIPYSHQMQLSHSFERNKLHNKNEYFKTYSARNVHKHKSERKWRRKKMSNLKKLDSSSKYGQNLSNAYEYEQFY